MTQNRQLPPELLSIYAPQVIQQAINDRAMAWKAAEMGMKVSSDDTDNAIIDSIPAQYVKDGKVDAAMLARRAPATGHYAGGHEGKHRPRNADRPSRSTIAGGVVVTSQEVEKEYHQRNDKVKIQYAMLAPADFQKEAEPTEAEIQTLLRQQ